LGCRPGGAATARGALVVAVAAAGWLCAMYRVIALTAVMPLKRVDPFVMRVDNSTGLSMSSLSTQAQATLPEAVTRYFLDALRAICERFDYATAESDYEECGAFHNAARNQQWYAKWNRSNPNSPLNVYKDGTSIARGRECGQLLRAGERRVGSRASPVRQGDATSGRSRGTDIALDCDGPVRLRNNLERCKGAALESAGVQDSRVSLGAGSLEHASAAASASVAAANGMRP
jgi:hypothetical protein